MRRKLTTIVAADVVGYSRLLGEHEAATLGALELLRSDFILPKAAVNAGRIFRFLGDGTLLEFESALGAVEFAIDVQRSLAEHNASVAQQIPIVLRIGVNLGDVVFENDDIHGDGVNIAVRLETLAEPGGICLTDSVHAQIKNKVSTSFISVGPRNLKNIIDPVHVWRWRPGLDGIGTEPSERLQDADVNLNEQYVLDPQLIDLMLQLHARSVFLAISDALDDIIDENENQIRHEELYFRITERIHQARSMLNGIKIERVDNYRELSTSGPKHQTLGEFTANMFNDARVGYAFKIIPEAQTLLAGEKPPMVKRKHFMKLVREFHNDDYIKDCRRLIKRAYID